MSKTFREALIGRRSIYSISNNPVIPRDEIVTIVEDALKHTPSPFNSQSARVAVLFGENHHKLWSITEEALRGIVGDANFAGTKQKLDGFAAGEGTVLFFEDQSVVEGLQNRFPLYKDNFPVWSLESSGMLQFVIWTAFAEKGLGASLQHYNPVIDDKVKAQWGLPQSWKLWAQMPFGKKMEEAGPKEFNPLEGRLKIFK